MRDDADIHIERARVNKAIIIAKYLSERGVTPEQAVNFAPSERAQAGEEAGKPRPSDLTWAHVVWVMVADTKPPAPSHDGEWGPRPYPRRRQDRPVRDDPPYPNHHRVLVALDCGHQWRLNARHTGLTTGAVICPICQTAEAILERTPDE